MRFGTTMPASGILTKLCEIPTGYAAVMNINVCNTGSSEATIRIAITTKDTPDPSEYYEWDTTLIPTAVLERTALSLSEGYKVFVQASTNKIAFNAHGEREVG